MTNRNKDEITMAARRLSSLLLLLSFSWCHSLPTLVLTSPNPYCLGLDGPVETVLKISYEVPGLSSDLILAHSLSLLTLSTLSFCLLTQIDIMAMKPESVKIRVELRPWNRVYEQDLHEAPVRERTKIVSETVSKAESSFLYEFGVDGTAEICLQALDATPHNPVAAGIRVETSEELPSLAKRPEPVADVGDHLTHMETELVRISGAMQQLIHEAHMNQEQDELFHEQTLAMHSATTFWPIVQLCVLLMTGFTQASHIVRFFKSRRLI